MRSRLLALSCAGALPLTMAAAPAPSGDVVLSAVNWAVDPIYHFLAPLADPLLRSLLG